MICLVTRENAAVDGSPNGYHLPKSHIPDIEPTTCSCRVRKGKKKQSGYINMGRNVVREGGKIPGGAVKALREKQLTTEDACDGVKVGSSPSTARPEVL